MLALVQITPWHWIGFILCVLIFIAIDLGIFRRPKIVSFREALIMSGIWFALAILFGAALAHWRSHHEAVQFLTGYLIELSLSLDNILVIALIFAALRVPAELQHRVLIWGILGALAMRGAMIGVGAELIQHFDWTLYIFGAFLVFAGGKMFFEKKEAVEPEKNFLTRAIKKVFPVTTSFEGPKFFSRLNGKFALTPLALALLFVETTDLIFAVDSVPAVFSVTRSAFIVFTSNVFAILGLRSLYFLLAGAIGRFRYLKAGLAIVLIFVGIKMLLDPHDETPKWFQHEISTGTSLLVIAVVLSISIGFSIAASRKENAIAS